jgi:hypothetical protein
MYTYCCKKCGFYAEAVTKEAIKAARKGHERTYKMRVSGTRTEEGFMLSHSPCPLVLVAEGVWGRPGLVD